MYAWWSSLRVRVSVGVRVRVSAKLSDCMPRDMPLRARVRTTNRDRVWVRGWTRVRIGVEVKVRVKHNGLTPDEARSERPDAAPGIPTRVRVSAP